MNLSDLFASALCEADFAPQLRKVLSDQAIVKYCEIYATETQSGRLRTQNEAILVRAFHGAAVSQGISIAQIGEIFARATSQWLGGEAC
jgi:hypothetical protein